MYDCTCENKPHDETCPCSGKLHTYDGTKKIAEAGMKLRLAIAHGYVSGFGVSRADIEEYDKVIKLKDAQVCDCQESREEANT
ncbi:MAG: hypothetical protein KAS32_03010 [Candidatus Peribacteraceae bacterium]|nr:hypothetical protein [Candidatus Peribacteraceae bacterium]